MSAYNSPSSLGISSEAEARSIKAEFRTALADFIEHNPQLVEDNVLVRLTDFEIGNQGIIAQSDVSYTESDIFMCGQVTVPNEADSGRVFLNERVLLETPKQSKEAIKATRHEDYEKNCVPIYNMARWSFQASMADRFIASLLSDGFDITAPIEIFQDLLEIPVNSNDEAETGTGHSEGGATTPAVKTGACPVDGCDYHSENFLQLRGHIGGKVKGGDEKHKQAQIRIDDYR